MIVFMELEKVVQTWKGGRGMRGGGVKLGAEIQHVVTISDNWRNQTRSLCFSLKYTYISQIAKCYKSPAGLGTHSREL